MKRPQGPVIRPSNQTPAPQDSPAQGPPAQDPPAARSAPTKQGAGKSTAASTAASTAKPAAKTGPRPGAKATAKTAAKPNVTGTSSGGAMSASAPVGSPVSADTDESRPLGVREAGRQLKVATRRRRQFERAEVRRFTKRTRQRRTAWLVGAGLVVALVAFAFVGAYSPLMALQVIHVEGTKRVDAEQVVSALAAQIGRPLPLVDGGEVRQSLSGFPLIRSYTLESRPPDTLVVRVVEREPVGVIVSGANFDLVDAAGVVIESAPERPVGYPVIQTAGPANGPAFHAATSVVVALPEELRALVDKVTAETKDDVAFVLVASGQRVIWGSIEDSENKAAVLSALMATQDPAVPVTFDVSSANSPVIVQ